MHFETDLFKIRVGVVVLNDRDEMLLARQNGRSFFVLPGGTLEKGETLGECAVREIKEEANLDIRLGPMLFVADFFAPDGTRQAVDVVFLGHLLGGNFQPETIGNINEIGFYSREQLVQLPVKPERIFEHLLDAWETDEWPQGVYLGR